MSLSYYTNNSYFDDIIREYLENDPRQWVRDERPTEKTTLVDMDYYMMDQIPICKIMSQMDGLDVLGNKRKQYQLMERDKPESIGDYIPRTYPFSVNTINSLRPLFDGRRKYIVKPDNGMMQRGIKILEGFDECLRNVNLYSMTPDCGNEWILQDFIEPLLYDTRKYHLRVYVLLVMTTRGLKTYAYDGGMMYFAKDPYDPQDLSEGPNLTGGFMGGAKRFPEDFESAYGSQKVTDIRNQVKRIVKETIDPSVPYLRCKNSGLPGHKAYKMLGYDILIDDKGKCHLGEINVRHIGMTFPSQGFRDKLYRDLMTTVHYPQTKTSFTLVGNYPCKRNTQRTQKTQKTRRTPRKPLRTQKRRKRTQKLSREK